MKGLFIISAAVCICCLTTLTAGFMSDSNVAGYEPFSRLLDRNSSILGLLWTDNDTLLTSRCFELTLHCEDEKILYQHHETIVDLDIYYDKRGLYLCDAKGAVYWIDLNPASTTAGFVSEHLTSTLDIEELSVDWLSEQLYAITANSQFYRCDSQLKSCHPLHQNPLHYHPTSLVADPYNGYLYWKNTANSLVKHDLSPDLTSTPHDVQSDVIIKSHVQSYSVAFNHYDLYSINYYNNTHSDISLTYLNGQNQRSHIPLKRVEPTFYSQLNCFHDEYCLWLESTADNDTTNLSWHRQLYNQKATIMNLNLTKNSIMKLWHRGVQPIPILETSPDWGDVYTDSTSITINWRKPDILAYLIKAGQLVNIWGRDQVELDKYMQSDAAWSNWTYELNYTNLNSNHSNITTIITDLRQTSYRIDKLQPKTYYQISILAYNDVKRGDTNTSRVSTLTDNPTIYTSNGHVIKASDSQSQIHQMWQVNNWKICDMTAGEDNNLYTISVPDQFSCSNQNSNSKMNLAVITLPQTENSNASVSYTKPGVSSASYDWIGKNVYVYTSKIPHIIARITLETVTAGGQQMEALTSDLSTPSYKITVEPVGKYIYLSDGSKLERCQTGIYGVCESTLELLHRPNSAFTRLSTPLIDRISSTPYWASLSSTGFTLDKLLPSARSTGTGVTGSFSSSSMRVADDNLYLFVNGTLRSVDINTRRLTSYNDITGSLIAYSSPRSFPLIQGMNTTDDVTPYMNDSDIDIRGDYNNMTMSWALSSKHPATVEVSYDITVSSVSSGEIIVQEKGYRNDSISGLGGGLSPETLLRISITPYTSYRTGEEVVLTYTTLSTFPGVVTEVSIFMRRVYDSTGEITPQLIIKWKPPDFTGGTITNYTVNIKTEEGIDHYDDVGRNTTATLPVGIDALYNITVRAWTKAGAGEWSIPYNFNTSIPSVLPLLNANTHTPERVQVVWDLSSPTSQETLLYNYSLVYQAAGQMPQQISRLTIANRFYSLESLEHNTTYQIKMLLCSTSENTQNWFAGQQCEYSNVVEATTFIEPEGLVVVKSSDTSMTLQWHSPRADEQIKTHLIRYSQVGSEGDSLETDFELTEPDFNYTFTLTDLQPNAGYIVTLVLSYDRTIGYTIPRTGQFIVTTNQSMPGAVRVSSAKCDKDDCVVTVEGDSSSTTKLHVQCEGQGTLIFQLSSDKTKVIPREQLTDDITQCVVTAQSSNDVGQGPMSSGVTFSMKTPDGNNQTLAMVISIAFVLLLVLAIAGIFVWKCRKWRTKSQQAKANAISQMNLMEMGSPTYTNTLRASASPQFPFNMTDNTAYASEEVTQFRESVNEDKFSQLPQFDRRNLMLMRFLGSGAFGEVYQGKAHSIATPDVTTLVAVKTLRSEASESDKEEFVKEAKLMSQFDNDYIVKLLGVCIDKEPYYLLLELMNKGDLVGFLRKSRPTRDKEGVLTLPQLLSICIDVAAGCKYLEMLHFVHRDLAARNCLVCQTSEDAPYQVKIGDFGLARDIYRNDYYRKEGEALLPVRWMSPEALVDGVFTTQSDIWAFGVLIWEVFSLAMQPYPARSNIEVLQFVTNSGLLERPVRCPNQIFEIMTQCWSYAASDRPAFMVIHKTLTDLQTQLSSPIVTQWFGKMNKRLTSEVEFFAGSTSSAQGADSPVSDVPDSPVFGADIKVNPDRQNSQSASEEYFSFQQTEERQPVAPRRKSFMDFFKRRASRDNRHTNLSRVNSTPVKKNRYVRSESTISADGIRAAHRTYYPNDSESETNTITPQHPHNDKHDLQVDLNNPLPEQSTSQPTVQYTTITYPGNTLSQIEETSSEVPPTFKEQNLLSERSHESTVQYSPMQFPVNTDGNQTSASAPVDEKVDTNLESISTDDLSTVQYSSMMFPKHEATKDLSDQEIESSQTKKVDESKPTSTVNYSTMRYPNVSDNETDSEGNEPLADSQTGTDDSHVQYAAMQYNKSEGDDSGDDVKSSGAGEKVKLELDVTRDSTPSSAPNTPPPPPINIPVIQSTPQGTRIQYNAHQFKSPAQKRRGEGRNSPFPKPADNNNKVLYSTMLFPDSNESSSLA